MPNRVPGEDTRYDADFFYSVSFDIPPFRFTPINKTEVTVEALPGADMPETLTIPATAVCAAYNDFVYKVAEVKEDGFRDKKAIKTVNIGTNVKKININAFRDSGTEVIFIGYVRNEPLTFGAHTMYGTNITEFYHTGGVKGIGRIGLAYMPKLERAMLFSTMDLTDTFMLFEEDPLLETVLLPYGLTSIGAHMFNQTTSLRELDIPPTVTEMGHMAFYQDNIKLNFYSATPPSTSGYPFSEANVTICAPSAYLSAYRTAFQNKGGTLTFEAMTVQPYFGIGQTYFSNNPQSAFGVMRIDSNVINGMQMHLEADGSFVPSFANGPALWTLYTGSGQFKITDIFGGYYRFAVHLSRTTTYDISFSPSPSNVVTVDDYEKRYEFIFNQPQKTITVNFTAAEPFNNVWFSANRTQKKRIRFYSGSTLVKEDNIWPGDKITDIPVLPEIPHKKPGYWENLPENEVMPDANLDVYATYLDYEITWIAQGEVILKRTYEYGETVTPPTPTVKAHYQFDHWDPTPVVTMTDGDKVYTAVYLGNPHTITYRVDGQVWQTQNVRYDDVISAPDAPQKRYHTFEGWTPALPATVPDQDLIVDAVYEPITYYISYMYDGHEMMKVGYKYNTTVTPPIADLEALKLGYYVSGFDPSLPDKMPGYDFSVDVIYDLKTYYITFVVEGQTYKTLGYLYSLPIQVPVVPPKTGYYGFWDYVPATMPYNDITVTAVYIAEGDAEIITDWPIFREKLVRDTDGDIRKGNIIGDTFTRPATIASYNQQGEAYYLDNVAVLLTDSTDTITTNYFYKRFNGTEDAAVDVELPVKTSEGKLYKADWLQSRTQNGVIFFLGSEFADTETIYYLQLEDYLEQVNDEFYQVLTNSVTGTQHRGNLVHVKSEVASWSGQYYESAYPKWQRNIVSADDERTYVYYIPERQLTRRTVIVRPAGNTPYQPDFSYGDEPWPYVMYPQGVRLYREYDSDMFEALFAWYDEDDYPIQAMSKEGDAFVIMTAGATSAGDNYTTLWLMSEGVIFDVIRKPAGTSISAWPSYSREGYTFSGVSTSASGSAISLPYTVPSSSTKLYILWTAVPVPPQPQPTPIWTLTYKVLGSVYATVQIPDNELVASYRPAAPSVSGYSFTGWSNEPVRATANATINAQFTQVATGVHTLTYKIGNTVIQTMSVATGDVIPVLPYPTRAGYTFDGWTGFPADMIMPANALTITGSWTAKPDPLNP